MKHLLTGSQLRSGWENFWKKYQLSLLLRPIPERKASYRFQRGLFKTCPSNIRYELFKVAPYAFVGTLSVARGKAKELFNYLNEVGLADAHHEFRMNYLVGLSTTWDEMRTVFEHFRKTLPEDFDSCLARITRHIEEVLKWKFL